MFSSNSEQAYENLAESSLILLMLVGIHLHLPFCGQRQLLQGEGLIYNIFKIFDIPQNSTEIQMLIVFAKKKKKNS